MMETSIDILKEKAKKIKYFFSDIDGTLTDGCVYYSPEGELLKKFSLRDGTGYFLLRQVGIKTGFITSECSPIVEQRAKKLRIDKYIFGTDKKVEAMQLFLKEANLDFENIAYIGDELNDVKLLRKCGLSFAVADAVQMVLDSSDIVCVHKGGNGAFREAVEILITLSDCELSQIVNDSL